MRPNWFPSLAISILATSPLSAARFVGSFHKSPEPKPVVFHDADVDGVWDMLSADTKDALQEGGITRQELAGSVSELQLTIGEPIKQILYPTFYRIIGQRLITEGDVHNIFHYLRSHVDPNFNPNHENHFSTTVGLSLNRITAVLSRRGEIIGWNIRLGRLTSNLTQGLAPFVADTIREGKSVLLFASPGKGKTTNLREFVREAGSWACESPLLGSPLNVATVETGEITGYDEVKPVIPGIRRCFISDHPDGFVKAILQAVTRNSPHLVVVDEVNEDHAVSAVIKDLGVPFLATTHSENIMTLARSKELLGGIDEFTIGDDNAKLYKGSAVDKSHEGTKKESYFSTVIQILGTQTFLVFTDPTGFIKSMLQGSSPAVTSQATAIYVTPKGYQEIRFNDEQDYREFVSTHEHGAISNQRSLIGKKTSDSIGKEKLTPRRRGEHKPRGIVTVK